MIVQLKDFGSVWSFSLPSFLENINHYRKEKIFKLLTWNNYQFEKLNVWIFSTSMLNIQQAQLGAMHQALTWQEAFHVPVRATSKMVKELPALKKIKVYKLEREKKSY